MRLNAGSGEQLYALRRKATHEAHQLDDLGRVGRLQAGQREQECLTTLFDLTGIEQQIRPLDATAGALDAFEHRRRPRGVAARQ